MKKRILSIVVIFTLAMTTSFAQGEQHLKFMGIPITGTINQFQSKLASKGITVDQSVNKYIGVGGRAFKGVFAGKKAQIYVYYDETTKIVYRAKAVIDSYDEDTSDNDYYHFVDLLTTKYPDVEVETGEHDGYESTTLYVPNNSTGNYQYLGSIDVFRSEDYSAYSLYIDYTDTGNYIKHEDRNLEDL